MTHSIFIFRNLLKQATYLKQLLDTEESPDKVNDYREQLTEVNHQISLYEQKYEIAFQSAARHVITTQVKQGDNSEQKSLDPNEIVKPFEIDEKQLK